MSLYCRIVHTILALTILVTFHAGPSFAQETSHRFQKEFTNSPILARYDQDGDGRISLSEFPGLPERFFQLDENGDGVLSLNELPYLRVYPACDRGRQIISNLLNNPRL